MDTPLNYNPLTTPQPNYLRDMGNLMKALWLRLNTHAPQPLAYWPSMSGELPGARPLIGPDVPGGLPDMPQPQAAPPQTPGLQQLLQQLLLSQPGMSSIASQFYR
jgi:hypothetical protein